MTLNPKADQIEQYQNTEGMKFESVDQIVLESINSIESEGFDIAVPLEIYNNI